MWSRAVVCALAGLVALPACLEDNARPYDEYLGDLAELVDAGVDAGDEPTDAGPPLCSDPAPGAAITVEFVNRTGRNGRLVWANEQCVTVQYAQLDNGATHVQPTYVGHAWRLLRETTDTIVGQVIVADGQTMVTFE